MLRKTYCRGLIYQILFGMVLLLVANQGFSATLSGIIEQAKEEYSKFEKVVKDMVILYEMKTTTEKGEMITGTKVLKKGEKSRIEMTMQMPGVPAGHLGAGGGGMKTITIYDGKDTWTISPFMGKQKLPQGEGKERPMENWFDRISEKAKLIGTDRVDKRDAYVIEVKEEDIPPYKMWIDKSGFVQLKMEVKSAGDKTVVTLFSDFKTIKGGWEIPYKTETYEDKKLMATFIVKSVEINKGLSDDLFDPDKVEIKSPVDMQEMMKKMMQGQGE